MAVNYKSIIPWGRSFDEYKLMFNLSENDLTQKIVGCGDGPASFNKTMKDLGNKVISCDPIYILTKEEIQQRINETKDEVIQQVSNNMQNYNWSNIKNIDELLKIRMNAMQYFLEDYNEGKKEGRYLPYSLPELILKNKEFDIALCSHLIFLFINLSLDFHIKSINEMLRIAREVRIFPLIDLNCNKSVWLEPVIKFLIENKYKYEIIRVQYEFHKNGNEMLRIVA